MAKDVKNLFIDAMRLDSKVDAAREALERAVSERSMAVKAVFTAHGGENGPFSYKGSLFTIRKRAKRDDEGNVIPGEETWFFVKVGGKTLTTID